MRVFCSTLLLSLGCGWGVTAFAAADFEQKIQADMQHHHIPGVSIVIIDHGKIKNTLQFGYSNTANKQKITEDTLFQVPANADLITPTTALITFHRQRLSLDEDINHFLTGWKIPAHPWHETQPITMRLLLQHYAAISPNAAPEATPTPETADVPSPVQVNAEPGTAFVFSEAGFRVVQQLLSDQYEQPFQEVAQSLLFSPLNMSHSTYTATESSCATGYQDASHAFTPYHTAVPSACLASEVWTTPTDLAKLIIAFQRALAGKSDGPLTQTVALQLLTPDKDPNFGLGVGVNLNERGEPVKQGDYFGQHGYEKGYYTTWLANKEHGTGFVIMVNSAPNTTASKTGTEPFVNQLIQTIIKEKKWQ